MSKIYQADQFMTFTGGTGFLKADGSVDSKIYITGITNVITGTGVTNYLPKWNSSSSLTNSLIYDTGTQVGLGTIAPSFGYIFHVSGATKIENGDLYIRDGGLLFGPTAQNAIYKGGTDFFIARNYNQEYTIWEVWAPPSSNVLTDDREATLALVREDTSGNTEFMDVYNNGYASEKQFGVRIQSRGTGQLRNFIMDFSTDGINKTRNFLANSGRTDFSVPVTIFSSLTATALIKSGGTSTQFLKADGSVDSNVYITNITNNITGNGTTNIISKFNSASGITNSNISDNGVLVTISAGTNVIGAITGGSFVKTGGTSTQFLKADGSVDSNIYITGIANNITGNGTTNVITKFNSASGITNSSITDTGLLITIATATTVNSGDLTITSGKTIVGGVGNYFYTSQGSLGNKYVSNKPGSGFFAQGVYGTAPNIRWGIGITTDPTANPTGDTLTIFDSNAVGIGGIIVNNTIDRLQISGSVISTGGYKVSGGTSTQFLKADGSVDSNVYITGIVNNITGNGTTNIISKFNGVSGITNSNISDNGVLVTISAGTNVIGAITGGSFIKTGGTSTQFLKADGSVDSNTYITGIPNNITGNGTTNIISKFNGVSGITNSNISDNGVLVSISSNTLVIGAISATSFVKTGGTSSQFLKADGSVDSNVYITGFTNTFVTGGTYTATGGTSGGTLTFRNNTGGTFSVSGASLIESNFYKQNSMVIDGTGTKYPTVDATNTVVNTSMQAGTNTGFIDRLDTFNMALTSTTVINITGTSSGAIVRSKLFTPPFAPSDAIVNFSGRTYSASSIILTGDGRFFKYLGYDYTTNTILNANVNFVLSDTIVALGHLEVKRNGGVNTFTSFQIQPDIATVSNFDNVMVPNQTTTKIFPNANLTVNNTAGLLKSQGINWGSINSHQKNVNSNATLSFIRIDPSYLTTSTGFASGTTVDTTTYWNGSALVSTGNNNSASIQRWLITLDGRFWLQAGEATYSTKSAADAAVQSTIFTDILPTDIAIELCRMTAVKNATNLSDTTQAQFYYTSAGGSSAGGGGASFGTLGGSPYDNTLLGIELNNKLNVFTGTTNVLPKSITATGLTNSNISDNGTLVTISANTNVIGAITATSIVKSGGTSAQYLMADGSVTTASSGGIGGSGTVNTLAKFNSSTAITNSNITDNGSLITFSGPTLATDGFTAVTIVKSGGTSNQFLMADGSVSLGTSGGSATLSGGVTNVITKWISPTNVGNSSIIDTGTLITLSADTIVTNDFSAYTISVSGGTSSQFLKANGTLDSSIYEVDSNKTETIDANSGSTVFFPSVKGMWDWAVARFQSILVSGTNIKTIDGISLLGSGDIPSKIVITPTATTITTNTTDVSGNTQNGRTVMINNGSSAITITVSGGTMFTATYEKLGTGAITFSGGTGRTLVQVDATNILNGTAGSTASISSFNTTDNLRISNA